MRNKLLKLKWLTPARRSYRTFSTDVKYKKFLARRKNSDSCSLCNYQTSSTDVVDDHDNWQVIKNKFPYNRWDWQNVDDHLMLIPKRHLTELSEIYKKEWKIFGEIVSSYDKNGYSIYLRSQNNPIKSVAHLHWHLVKVD